MIEWKHKFEQNTLERGMTFYTNNRVIDLKEDNDIYSASVVGIKDFKVKIRVDKGFPAYMWCDCPIAEEGGNCEHMAAVLFAVEAEEDEAEVQYKNISDMENHFLSETEDKEEKGEKENKENNGENVLIDVSEYELLGGSWTDETKESEINSLAENNEDITTGKSVINNESLDSFSRYRFFNGTAIRKSMTIPESAYKKGEDLLRQRKIEILQITSDHASGSYATGRLSAIGISEQEKFSVNMTFSRTEVQTFECRCPKCRKVYFTRFPQKTDCPYKAGVVIMLEEYLATHNIGDTTDFNAHRLISFYQEKRADMAAAGVVGHKGSLNLIPRIIKKDEKLSVSFRVGEKKLYVIKSLDAFSSNVQKSAVGIYGDSTKINHSLENFTEKGKRFVHFIGRIVREETEFYQSLLESRIYYSYQKNVVGSTINLFGWRLDEFFNLLEGDFVEYENKDVRYSERRSLTCISRNPKVSMRISETKLEDDEFHGVTVSGNLPDMYSGDDNAYYIDGDYLCRADGEFLKKIKPLSELSHENAFKFNVGRNYMTEFFNRILPSFQGIVDITETEPEKFRQYLLPDAQFVFYLDAQDKNVTCKLHARYNEKEVSVFDIMDESMRENFEPFRDIKREKEVLSQAMQWFPKYDIVEEELHCGSNEDLIYKLIESGTDRLMEIGKVLCTKRFLGYHAIKTVKVSVGVSISSGLLELDVSTDDIPQSEMLDILNSYRAKKKYYRLKDGSFINLNDSSMEMLAELMESMNLKPREFVKGKMNLPMYRALYLDKMLEENSLVYRSRDSRFKEIVKNFKTVSDADFEEPKSLSKIMRSYQKNGYKWLRTLESWQFGGILADDMGLGKTLQVIAVLLASINEGRKRTSLVVCPASLVFNWWEEFNKFAPELKVAYITGTQEERRLKIEAYSEADVVITSYDLLKRDIDFYEDKEFEYEIIDEAQYIKNHTTEAAKAVKIVKSRIRYALTGTPIENRLSELWSIFDFLMPGFLYSYEVF
ncbi:MAG: SNF2 helicase associated domain-containing protein, partial [Butyrivibrio sp.]|nr:SNF2 helicase associated domain-containing protein [Butyrivibrio sp.]